MNVLLINPHRLFPKSLSVTLPPSPPLGLAYIAAAIEDCGHQVDIIDCIAEAPSNYFSFDDFENVVALGISFDELKKKLTKSYDMIGISVMFTNNWLANRKLINLLKQYYPNAPIVAGGEHVTAIPEYCLKDAEGLDIVAMGEGEDIIADICNLFADGGKLEEIEGIVWKDRITGEIKTNPRRKRIRELNEIGFPAWHLFPLQKYFDHDLSYGITYGNSLPIFATRGCPYECIFCSSPQMWGTKYSMRSVDNVIDEVKHLYYTYNVTNFDFYDLTAIINKRWILEFCKKVEQEKLVITWQIPAGTRSEAIDYEVAVELKNSGCKNITYAPESGSPEILDYIKKRVSLVRMINSIDDSYRAGLNIKLNIIMGYPDEKLSDMFKTVGFLIKASYHGAHDTSPSVFSPYPGSALFNEITREKKIVLSDRYFHKIVFSESFHDFKNYNRNVSKLTIILMVYLAYVMFYLSNFMFRPIRVIKLFSNVITENYQTRGEYVIGKMLLRRKLIKASS